MLYFVTSIAIILEAFFIDVSQGLANTPCHGAGRYYQCMPPFTNIVEGVKPEATSTCGSPPRNVCRFWTDGNNEKKNVCEMCDAENKYKSHPPEYLTDRHRSNNQTCWISGPVSSGSDSVVNITLSLHKKFEVYYISLQPCGSIPDSIAIYKSSDFGKTWKPWQYFSIDCYRAFRLPTSNEHNTQITGANIQEVLCVALKPHQTKTSGQSTDNVIAFSTTIGRPSSQPWSEELVDFMTMTDLKISLMRFPVKRNSRSQPFGDYLSHDLRMFQDRPVQSDKVKSTEPEISSETMHYAFSDLAVGGRCKCNGHASECLRDPNTGRLVCNCTHNTAGDDCEKCKEGFHDSPWKRATIKSPNICRPCDCNLHSSQCFFSEKVFQMTEGRSGSYCQACQDNTAGYRCYECKEGYFRDWTKPISHAGVCLKCRCHPIGSVNTRKCNKKTGQCECKSGVTGTICDRCAEGYKQTNDRETPCSPVDKSRTIPMAKAERPADVVPKPKPKPKPRPTTDENANKKQRSVSELDPSCKKCRAKLNKRIRFKKFCRKHVVFQANMKSTMVIGNYVRFEMRVLNVWRRHPKAASLIPDQSSLDKFALWVKTSDLRCECPQLTTGRSYLIISRAHNRRFRGRKELLLNHKSIVFPWQESWKRRLSKFKKREQKGLCKKHSRRAKIKKMGKNRNRRQNSYPVYQNSQYGNKHRYNVYDYNNNKKYGGYYGNFQQ